MCNSNARHLQIKTLKNRSGFFPLCSLWDYTIPPPPCPVHLPLPADVIPGRCHVLHRPSTSTESVRGAGGSFGSLPAAHETASVGLLDMVDNAVTVINHRWRHGASFNLLLIFCFFVFFRSLFFLSLKVPGPTNTSAIWRGSTHCLWFYSTLTMKKGKCVIPEICSFHVCMYICTKVVGMPLHI